MPMAASICSVNTVISDKLAACGVQDRPASAAITLQFGVENYLRERVPEIQGLDVPGMPAHLV